MRSKLANIAVALVFGLSLGFAQEIQAPELVSAPEPTPTPTPQPAPVAALPKPSVAQALSGINLPGGCAADFTSIFEKDDFSMAEFMKKLPLAVGKTKLQLKSPFGKPQDSDRTDVGLTVGCIKALPESPVEIASLLKNIGLKMGLDLAAGAASVADSSIPANVPNECSSPSSGGGVFGTVMSISLISSGLGTIIYGITQNGEVARHVDNKNGKAAVAAERSRNMSYGIGAGLLAGGLVVFLVF